MIVELMFIFLFRILEYYHIFTERMSRKLANGVKNNNLNMDNLFKDEPQGLLVLEENRMFLQQLIDDWDARVDEMLDNLALLINEPWDDEGRKPRACVARG